MRRYYDHLTKRGVHRYAWEELRGDYALGAAQALYVAAGWCGIEGDPQPMRWVWGGAPCEPRAGRRRSPPRRYTRQRLKVQNLGAPTTAPTTRETLCYLLSISAISCDRRPCGDTQFVQ